MSKGVLDGCVDPIPRPFVADRCVSGRFPSLRKHATREGELEEPSRGDRPVPWLHALSDPGLDVTGTDAVPGSRTCVLSVAWFSLEVYIGNRD